MTDHINDADRSAIIEMALVAAFSFVLGSLLTRELAELELAELDRVVRAGNILDGRAELSLVVNSQAALALQASVRSPRVEVEGFELRQLRAKLEDDPPRPRHILTVRGIGYRFDG